MAIEFTYKVLAVRVRSEGSLHNVVKEVDVEVIGADGGVSSSLPTTVKLGDPDQNNFSEFSGLTESQIVSWVESHPSMEPIRGHVAFGVSQQLQNLALVGKSLPWAAAE